MCGGRKEEGGRGNGLRFFVVERQAHNDEEFFFLPAKGGEARRDALFLPPGFLHARAAPGLTRDRIFLSVCHVPKGRRNDL